MAVELPNPFFVTGGTLRPDAPCYIERAADAELFAALSRGELCYLLTSRQMGKSSLMVRTAARLRREGRRVVVLDLTAVGKNLTAEQWYRSLLDLVGEQLGLETELARYWSKHLHLGPFRRFMAALETAASTVPAADTAPDLVVFVDEIDAVQSLPFSSDEFFAGIRELHNRRAENPGAARMTFCLLGVAIPADLIRDPRSTPFNVGRRIELTDFTAEEAWPLAPGLEAGGAGIAPGTPRNPSQHARNLLARILYWTAGQPYLTQRLCQAVAEALVEVRAAKPPSGSSLATRLRTALSGRRPLWSRSDHQDLVDRVCRSLFFAPGARKRDPNLHLVHERLLQADADRAALLDLYARIHEGQSIRDRETNRLAALLQLAGVVRPLGEYLRPRNRIYASVFDRTWIREHLPHAEQRRQQAAFRRGLTRAALVSGVVLSLVSGLAGWAVTNEREAHGLAERLRLALAEREAALQEKERALSQLRYALENIRRERNRATREAERARQSELRANRQRHVADDLRLRAEEATDMAELGRRRALRLQKTAERERAENRESLVRVSVANGNRLVAEGRPYEGLLWMVQALELDERKGTDAQARAHRERIASLLRESPRVRQVWGADARAVDLILSGDGTRAAGAFANRTVRMWDTRSGRQIGPTLTYDGSLRSLYFSADSRRLLVAGEEEAIHVVNTAQGEPLGAPLRHAGELRSAEFSPDGTRVVAAYTTRSQVWDLQTGRSASPTLEDGKPVRYATFSPDGQFVATAVEDGNIRLWPRGGVEPLPHVMKALPDYLRFSPDGRWLVGRQGHGALVWEVVTGRLHLSIPEGNIHALRFSEDSRRLATACGGHVRVWDLVAGAQTGRVMKHDQAVLSLAFDPVGTRLQTVTAEGTVRLWHPLTGEEVAPSRTLPGPGWSAALDMQRDRVLLSRGEGLVFLWDLTAAGAKVQSHHPVTRLPLSPSRDGQRVLSAEADGSIRVLQVGTGKPVGPRIQPGVRVVAVALDSAGRQAAVASPGGEVRVWDVASARPIGRTVVQAQTIQHLQFTANDRRLLCVGQQGSVYLWELETREIALPTLNRGDHRPLVAVSTAGEGMAAVWDAGQVLLHRRLRDDVRAYHVHHRDARTLAFNPDGSLLLTGGGDRAVRLWHTDTGRQIGPPLEHDSIVVHAAFSPDGKLVVICGENRSVRVWRIADRQPLAPVLRHAGALAGAEFSPDGLRLVTLTAQGMAQLWDVRTGEALTVPTRIGQDGGRAWFTSDGKRVLLALDSGDLHVWHPEADRRPADDLRRIAETLSAQRLDRKAGLQGVSAESLLAAWQVLSRRVTRVDETDEKKRIERSRAMAHQLEQASVWAGAAAHLDQVIRAHPQELALRHRRARARAEIGRYARAADDLAVAVEMGSHDRHTYYSLALLRLAAGDRDAYQRVCTAMLDRFETAGGLHEKDLTAWTCVLGPNAPANLRRAYRIMQDLLVREPHNPNYHHTLGALYYRAGRYPEAADALRQALRDGKAEDATLYHLYLVLTLHRTGEGTSPETRHSLAQARQWIERTEGTSTEFPVPWTDRVERMLILRELEEIDSR